jgi:C4-type Zn-finger protein
MKMKKMIEDQCPNCHADHSASMEDYEIDYNALVVKLYCQECDTTWYEYFKLEYDGYSMDGKVYDKDGNEDE